MVDYRVALVTFVGSVKSTYRSFFFTYEKQELARSHFSPLKKSLVISWILVVYRNVRSIVLLWNGGNLSKLIWYDAVSTVTQFSIYPFRKRWSRSSQFFSPLPTLGKSFPPKWRKILSLDLGGHLTVRPLLRFLYGIVCFSVSSIQIIFSLG